MRIKVSTVKLIAAIEARKEKLKQEYTISLSRADKVHADYRKAVISRLLILVDNVKDAPTIKAITKVIDRYELGFPHEPEVPKLDAVTKFDEVLKRLRLTDEEFMTLDDKDDYFRYV